MSQSDETVHITYLIDVIFSRHIAEGEVHKKKTPLLDTDISSDHSTL